MRTGRPVIFDKQWVVNVAIPKVNSITDKFATINENLSEVTFYTGGKTAIMRELYKINNSLSIPTFYKLLREHKDLFNSVQMCLDVIYNALQCYFITSGVKVAPQTLSAIYLNTYNLRLSDRTIAIIDDSSKKGLDVSDIDKIKNKILDIE